MNQVRELFRSPEWFPLTINFQRRVINFIHLEPDSYNEYLFLSLQAVQRRGGDIRDVRVDDALFAAATSPSKKGPVHYILHTAYCCSTLLARYFDLIPNCIVLKEPELLAQVALAQSDSREWRDVFDLSVRLLTRTYTKQERVVIKAHVPCNTLAHSLLEDNEKATIIFLLPQLRSFLLAVLKSMDRCNRVRSWNRHISRLAIARSELVHLDPDSLTDGESAAYWWFANRHICEQLLAGPYASRITVIDADLIPNSPRETLDTVIRTCETQFDEQKRNSLLNDPMVQQYSKDLSRPYDAEMRRRELADLERCWGNEADKVMQWLAHQKLSSEL